MPETKPTWQLFAEIGFSLREIEKLKLKLTKDEVNDMTIYMKLKNRQRQYEYDNALAIANARGSFQ